jgi:3-oxosteroid 1-dehydrogenase
VALGRALIANLFLALRERDIPLWLETGLSELVMEGGRVVGVVAEKKGETIAIRARKGVALTAGGFEHNASMREQFMPEPASTEWTCAAVGNTGDVIRIGMKSGAAVDLMDDAWWAPSFVIPEEAPFILLMERSCPGSIMVDSTGKRFVNEAASYVDVGQIMYRHNGRNSMSVPAHFVMDRRFRNNYFLGWLAPGQNPRSYIKKGYIKKAATLRELAVQAGIDPDGLQNTVERFNEFARTGKDLDFGRGDSEYDRSYADPTVKPNPCLAPIEKPPFYSINVYPGDLGTKGGLVINERAQVLREDGSVIDGLYAAGNTAASVMGNTYPGGGSTLGPAMTFGYLAALHAADRLPDGD